MNKFEELSHNVEALFLVASSERKLFSPVYHFINTLHSSVAQTPRDARKDEIVLLAGKILRFHGQCVRDLSFRLANPQVIQCGDTISGIWDQANELAKLSDDDFEALKPAKTATQSGGGPATKEPCVFIGHGRSLLWERLNRHLRDDLCLKTVHYDSESRSGEFIGSVLEKMLDEATFAVLVLTAEDPTNDDKMRARQNVIHEAGLFQGRLGFGEALMLVQEGIEGFSNVDGLQTLRFSGENITGVYHLLRGALEKKGVIPSTLKAQ